MNLNTLFIVFQPFTQLLIGFVVGRPEFNSLAAAAACALYIANWSASCQLGFLTPLCLFRMFVSLYIYIGPEKPH